MKKRYIIRRMRREELDLAIDWAAREEPKLDMNKVFGVTSFELGWGV